MAGKKQVQGRNWCFTLNNYSEGDLKKIDDWAMANTSAYLMYGKEVGENGTPHLQGFVHLTSPRAFTYIKKIVPKAHIERAKGTPAENIAYCSKDGEVTSYGPVPQTQQEVNKNKAKRFIELSKKGDFKTIEEEMPNKYIQQYRTMHQIHTDSGEKPADLDSPCGVWIYGETGSGKTTAARTEYGTYFSKPCNKWWDGYDPNIHECVVIDDIDPKHSCLAHHVKLWTDKWSFTGEVKNGTRSLRPKKVVITSQHTIQEVFNDAGPEAVEAITRRCKVIHKWKDCDDTQEDSPDIEVERVITPGQRRMFLDIQN